MTQITNPHPCDIQINLRLDGRSTFAVAESERAVVIAPRDSVALGWDVNAIDKLGPSDRLDLSISAVGRPALPVLPIIFVGAVRWRVLDSWQTNGSSDRELFDAALQPEVAGTSNYTPDARPGDWRVADAATNDVPFAAPLDSLGVAYAQTFTWSPSSKKIRLGVASSVPTKIWLNGVLVNATFVYRPFRPNYGGVGDGKPVAYVEVELQAGWNEIFLKFVRSDHPIDPRQSKLEAALVLTDPSDHVAGLTDQTRSRFPWE